MSRFKDNAASGKPVYDFTSAYERKHGRLPGPLLESQMQEATISRVLERRHIVSAIDLEKSPAGILMLREVSAGDEVRISAGNAVLKAVFRGLDADGNLVFKVLNNGRDEGDHALKIEECHILWHGIRMDWSSFTLFMRRVAGKVADALGKVELSAYFERFLSPG